jgi:Holliday junction resolvase RusA-like endonuclease
MARRKEYVINIAPIPWRDSQKYPKEFYTKDPHNRTAFGIYLVQQHGDDPLFTRPVQVEASFYMPIPKNVCERRKTIWHDRFPTIDELRKFIFEAITKTGTIWKDDRIVSKESCQKLYDKNPRAHIIITELE